MGTYWCYKPENKDINNRIRNNNISNKDISEINIIYNINKENINIFGPEFVKNNQNICQMIIDNKEYKITETYNVQNYNNNNILQIKLKGIDNVINMGNMFNGCSSLSSLPDISKWNTRNVTYMIYMFDGCSSLSSLPDISKWNTINVNDISNKKFNGCLNIIFSKMIKIKFKLEI